MPLLLPAESVRSLPAKREVVEAHLAQMKADREDGYLRLTGVRERILIVSGGQLGAAGEWADGRFSSIDVDRFLAWIDLADAVEIAKSPAAARALPLLFRGALSARLPADWVEARPLFLESMRRSGKDVVLAIRRGEVFSLALCPAGKAAELHLGPEEPVPPGSTPGDQLSALLAMNPDLVIDAYESETILEPTVSMAVPAAPPADAAEDAPSGEIPSLLVLLGDRIVWRFRPKPGSFTIGRGGENDLPLDNLSISRRHARGRVSRGGIVLEDLGSENGLMVGTKRHARYELRPGERLRLGKYTLMLGTGSTLDEMAAPEPSAASAVVPLQDTLQVSPTAVPLAQVEHDGKSLRISGLIFAIGSADSAHLQLPGLFIAPVHVRIFRAPDGTHTATHVAGWRRMVVNGQVAKEKILKDGDVLTIGRHRMLFRQSPLLAPSTKVSLLGPGR